MLTYEFVKHEPCSRHKDQRSTKMNEHLTQAQERSSKCAEYPIISFASIIQMYYKFKFAYQLKIQVYPG